MTDTRIITLDMLADLGYGLADVRGLDPAPVEYTALDGRPCWLAEYLLPLLDAEDPS
jgi:hypothetical protein